MNSMGFRKRFKNETIEKTFQYAERGLAKKNKESEREYKEKKRLFKKAKIKKYNLPTAIGLNKAVTKMESNIEKAKKREYNPVFRLGK